MILKLFFREVVMVVFPFFGSLALASATILERSILKHKSISVQVYQVLQFLSIVLLSLPLLYFFWSVDPLALSRTNLLIFLGVIISSVIANYLTFYAVKGKKVSALEPAKLFEPLFVVLLAFFASFISAFFTRDTNVVIPALIAGLALVWSQVEHARFTFDRFVLAQILGSFFFALELILAQFILSLYNPLTFYFLRCVSILAISFMILPKKRFKISKPLRLPIILTATLWILYRISIYYGYQSVGVMETTLMVMLGPIFIYLFAWKFLKEKISYKSVIAGIVILGSILYVTFV